MSRVSGDVMRGPYVWHGFDYTLQVWVENGKVLPCCHPQSMGHACCNGRLYAGLHVEAIHKVNEMMGRD